MRNGEKKSYISIKNSGVGNVVKKCPKTTRVNKKPFITSIHAILSCSLSIIPYFKSICKDI